MCCDLEQLFSVRILEGHKDENHLNDERKTRNQSSVEQEKYEVLKQQRSTDLDQQVPKSLLGLLSPYQEKIHSVPPGNLPF